MNEIPVRLPSIGNPWRLLLIVLLALAFTAPAADPAGAGVTQPRQPKSGPGGSNYNHGFRVSSGGEGANAWFVFEPVRPKPRRAPVAILTHGYNEFSGYRQLDALIRHTVRKGTIVIYPRWQTGIVTPCPGPFAIQPCIDSTVSGIKGAIQYLRADGSRVQPNLAKASYWGLSFGGIITANMLNRYRSLDLPKPRVVFLDDPHDGGLTGAREPSLDDSLAGIPSSTLIQCHSGASGIFAETYDGVDPVGRGLPKKDASCNAVFPKLTSIPARNKDLVLTSDDSHGSPALSSEHGTCAGSKAENIMVDAYDWGFCWKVWDALRSCAFKGKRCEYALGNTARHRYNGTWSDGKPIIGLKIRKKAPIRATPIPGRQPDPVRRPSRSR